jgi:dephospho-CoA kinase
LGAIVFRDPAALQRLEAIVHPATFELARWDIAESEAKVVVLEAIKLLESGRMMSLSDEIWVITSSPEAQFERLINRRGSSKEDARMRMAAQPTQAEKVARADHVIVNDGAIEALYAQLDVLWDSIQDKLDARRMAEEPRDS